MSSIFLSHSHQDKQFARRLADNLKRVGVSVWIDEAELKVGDSLIEKIRAGIDQMEYVGVLLSSHSVKSEWVRREVDIAMNQEILGKRIKVLPILIEDCELPGFLLGKLYADFREANQYENALSKLLDRLGVKIRLLPKHSAELFTMLRAAFAREDEILIRKTIMAFLSLPEGRNHLEARNVLGAVKVQSDRTQEPDRFLNLTAEVVLDALLDQDEVSLAAIKYLLSMRDYFPKPPAPIVEGTASANLGHRIGSNLCLFKYDVWGDSKDAEAVLPDRTQPLPFRVASALLLGYSARGEGLTEIAELIYAEPSSLQEAVFWGLDVLSRTGDSDDAFRGMHALMNNSTTDYVRKLAAKRFIELARSRNDVDGFISLELDMARRLLES